MIYLLDDPTSPQIRMLDIVHIIQPVQWSFQKHAKTKSGNQGDVPPGNVQWTSLHLREHCLGEIVALWQNTVLIIGRCCLFLVFLWKSVQVTQPLDQHQEIRHLAQNAHTILLKVMTSAVLKKHKHGHEWLGSSSGQQ